MSAIKGILLDKDGTLIDYHATWLAPGRALALRAADGDAERADRLLEAGGYDLATGLCRPDSVLAAGTSADIVALWYPDLAASEQRRVAREFDAYSAETGGANPVPLPGCREAVRALHRLGLALGVATNDSTASAERTLLALGIAQKFVAVYGCDAVAAPKPAPDTVMAFCDLTRLKPSQVAVVGDNRHDLAMARAGGCGLAIGVLSGTGTRETLGGLADVVLASVAELPALLAPVG